MVLLSRGQLLDWPIENRVGTALVAQPAVERARLLRGLRGGVLGLNPGLRFDRFVAYGLGRILFPLRHKRFHRAFRVVRLRSDLLRAEVDDDQRKDA